MPDHSERWVVNHLIHVCRDEEMALRYAAAHVQDPAVKALLDDLASQRAQFAMDLLPHAQRIGAADTAGGTTRAALHRRWMAMKSAVLGCTDKGLLAEAEHGEALALASYINALNDMLPISMLDLVERQSAEIRTAHNRVQAFLSH